MCASERWRISHIVLRDSITMMPCLAAKRLRNWYEKNLNQDIELKS